MKADRIQKFAREINRQRISPGIWDYPYLLLRSNLKTFSMFKELADKENRIRILDVGCGFKPWPAMFDKNRVEYIGVDFDREKSLADFIASADRLPFPDDNFDALIYSEVLEHAENLNSALSEMRRVAKHNALVFISSPFVFFEHGVPYDFQRLTRYFYQNVFKHDEIISIKESNSSLSTVIVSLNLFIESTPFSIFRGIKHLIYIFNNLAGMAVDMLTALLFKIIGKRFKEQFYSMPLGYSLIIRIKK